jgi:Activator of Hsp90 ATPase homolog 1-like protein
VSAILFTIPRYLAAWTCARIRVDEADRPARVRWTVLVSEPLPDWAGTTITFDITPAGDGSTVLHFTHHGLTPQLECFSMCSASWTQYLASLVDYADRDGALRHDALDPVRSLLAEFWPDRLARLEDAVEHAHHPKETR